MSPRYLALIASVLLLGGASAGAATTIYQNDFTSAGSDLPNENSGTGTGSAIGGSQTASYVASGNGLYRQTATNTLFANPIVQSATVNLGTLGHGSTLDAFGEFTLTTTFKMNTTNSSQDSSGDTRFGVLLFSDSASNVVMSTNTATPTGPKAYALNWGVHPNNGGTTLTYGQFNFVEYGGNGGAANPVSTIGDVNPVKIGAASGNTYNGDTVYGFIITGVRDINGLTLTAQMTIDGVLQNGAGQTATMTDATPLTGDYFGYRSRIVSNGGNWTVDYDNISITTPDAAVPEPASLASIGVVGTLLALRRRK